MDLRQRITSLRDSWLLAADIMDDEGNADMLKAAQMVRYYAKELTNILAMEETQNAVGNETHA